MQGKLACRWYKRILHGFHGIAWPPLSITVAFKKKQCDEKSPGNIRLAW
jgi:hypothetical protein